MQVHVAGRGASPDPTCDVAEMWTAAQMHPAELCCSCTSQVVCINPGRLVKGDSGGTWARLQVQVGEEARGILSGKAAETNAPVPHRVDQRCRAEIVKI